MYLYHLKTQLTQNLFQNEMISKSSHLNLTCFLAPSYCKNDQNMADKGILTPDISNLIAYQMWNRYELPNVYRHQVLREG